MSDSLIRPPQYMLGRKERQFDSRIPHLSALLAGRRRAITPPPPTDWSRGMPIDLGMMLNDRYGCCTISAAYHGVQVWSFNATGRMLTEPDSIVLEGYELIDGYDPNDSSTDQGGVEQRVLKYWLRRGIPMASGTTNRCTAFIEIDPDNDLDVNLGIFWTGFVYIGFKVPAFLLPETGAPPGIWDVNPDGDNTIIGGHAVVAPGFTANNMRKIISWGTYYQMTPAFWHQFVDEVYCIADTMWINAKGMTPAGLSLTQLEQQMKAIRGA